MASLPHSELEGASDSDSAPLLLDPRRWSARQANCRLATVLCTLSVVVIGITVALICIFVPTNPITPTKPDLDALFTFLVVGDWGRGNGNQSKCMQRMNTVAELWGPEFVVSTGDNFYPDGLSSVSDPKVAAYFTSMYSHPSLRVPWYAVLGNHDYGDGWKNDASHLACGQECRSPKWQYTAAQQAQDPRWFCQNGTLLRTFHNNTLAVLFIDTVPMIKRYAKRPWAEYAGGYKDQDPAAQLDDIRSTLESAQFQSAQWRIVVGHHAVRSYGEHCTNWQDCRDMSFLMPWFQNASVHMYLNGHDHDQQHVKFPNETTHYITSGAGSNCRVGEFVGVETTHAQFVSDLQGFVAISVSKEKLKASFFEYNSELAAHTFEIDTADNRKVR